MSMKRIGEIIGQEYKDWKKGDLVFINAGTGTGKSYFIENTLDEYCIENKKSILYLTNRDLLKEQVKNDLDELTNITVKNYQSIETGILKNVRFDNYDYVVMDESHYFFSDSSFSKKTNLFFERMLSDDSICKIMMTATPNIILNYFEEHNVQIDYIYELPTDYSYLDKVIAFNNHESIDSIIENIPQDEQILLFSSAKRSLEISEKYKGAFICSKHNKDELYEKYVKDTENEEERKSIIETGTYKNHILCTTTVLDNGVNIKEFSNVKHIIIDILDIDEFLQCLGRRRIGEGEKINLYFFSYKYNNKQINGFKSKVTNSLDMADYLYDKGEIEFVKHEFKKERFTDTRIIDDVPDYINQTYHKKVNECIYTKYSADLALYNTILDKDFPIPFKNIIAYQLKIKPEDIPEIETVEEIMSLEALLENLVGKKLYKDEQKELIEFIDLRQNGTRLKSPSSFNASFQEQKIPYIIDVPKTKSYRDENGKVKKEKTYWVVGKITYDSKNKKM